MQILKNGYVNFKKRPCRFKKMVDMDFFDSISAGKVRHKTLIYGGLENENRTAHLVRSWKSSSL